MLPDDMDAEKLKVAWGKFQETMQKLRARQLDVLRRFSKKAEEEEIRKIQDSLK